MTAQTVKLGSERLVVIDRERRTRQNHADNRRIIIRELVVRKNLAILSELADSTPYKLSGLRPEIENNNLFLHNVGRGILR